MLLWRLAAVFSVLSIFSFGGGNAIIPQLHADAVDRTHWITAAEFSRFFALARLAPGPTMNMATLIGFAVAGALGALIATAALFVPAGLIVYALGRVWRRFEDHPWRQRFALGLGPVVVGLIWAGVPAIAPGAIAGPTTIALALIATILLLSTNMNQSLLIAAGGAVGYFLLR
jgi:chromate transporter